MDRDKEQTKGRLVDAVLELIREKGFAKLGINAIATKAGVSKVLIYRYFGGLSGLFEAAAEAVDFTKTATLRAGTTDWANHADMEGLLHRLLADFQRAVSEDELTQRLMIQELQQENELTQAFARSRERQGLRTTDWLRDLLAKNQPETAAKTLDLEALLALISAGIYYLSLRARGVKMYNGIDIQSEEGWERIFGAITGLLSGTPPNEYGQRPS